MIFLRDRSSNRISFSCLWILFCNSTALTVVECFPYLLVLKNRFVRLPCVGLEVSYLCWSEEKLNNVLKTDSVKLFKHLLTSKFLDNKLSFHQHIKEIITKANKEIGVLKKLNNVLPRKALLLIYKSFVRPNLDYGDILYHQPLNESINSKLESI